MTLEHPVTASKQFDISMLIGVDKYWDVIHDEVIRGDGPTAVKSKTGYLLNGRRRYSCFQNIFGCAESILDTTVKLAKHSCSPSTSAFKILAGVLYKCSDRLQKTNIQNVRFMTYEPGREYKFISRFLTACT